MGAQQVGELLALNLWNDGRLPLLSRLTPYRLGASPSRYGDSEHRGQDPYVPRQVDAELDRALGERPFPFVLVVGDSKAGKSRTAFEAARRLSRDGQPHDPAVLVPKTTANLSKILDLDPPPDLRTPPALVWLDHLTEGELAGLSPGLLDRLRGRAIVLGTITAQRYDRVHASDSEAGRSARQTLARATVVRLDSEPTEDERSAAQTAYPAEQFDVGIGEQLVAAEQLVERYDNARQGAEPHGWAVVQAAIDWVRMDVGRPIRSPELAELYPLYLTAIRPTAQPKDLTEVLEWACQPVGARIALLQPILDESSTDVGVSYQPFDYLVGVADGQHGRQPQPIPEHAALLVYAPALHPLARLAMRPQPPGGRWWGRGQIPELVLPQDEASAIKD